MQGNHEIVARPEGLEPSTPGLEGRVPTQIVTHYGDFGHSSGHFRHVSRLPKEVSEELARLRDELLEIADGVVPQSPTHARIREVAMKLDALITADRQRGNSSG